MNITDTDIAASPAYYPQSFDVKGDRVMLVKMSAADYRLSSFLDSRILAPGMTAAWFDYIPVAVSADQVNDTNAYDKAEELRRELDKENQKSEGPAGKSTGTKVLP